MTQQTEFKLLRTTIDGHYKNIKTLLEKHTETYRELKQEIIELAQDMAKLCDMDNRQNEKQFITSTILKDLRRRGIHETVSIHLDRYVYRWLSDFPEYRLHDVDFSSPDEKILQKNYSDTVRNIVLEECKVHYETVQDAIKTILNLDDRLMTRTQLQDTQSDVGDLEINLNNRCNAKKIALITDAKKDDWQDRNKGPKLPPYHIKEASVEGKETDASVAWQRLGKAFKYLSECCIKISKEMEHYPPEEKQEIEDLVEAADTIGKVLLGPVYNRKCKLDFYDWAGVIDSLNEETISHAAKLTAVKTVEGGDPRGVTKEAVNDFIDPEKGHIIYFKKFVNSVGKLRSLNSYFNDRLKPYRQGLTKVLEYKYHRR